MDKSLTKPVTNRAFYPSSQNVCNMLISLSQTTYLKYFCQEKIKYAVLLGTLYFLFFFSTSHNITKQQ